MSLVMAIANKNGIVVSGDRRLTIAKTYHAETEFTYNRYSDRFQKIYISNQGHAFGVAGCAVMTDGQYVTDVLYGLIQRLNEQSLGLKEELVFIRDNLQYKMASLVSILCAGIENGRNLIFRTYNDDEHGKIISETDGIYGGAAIGMHDVAFKLMKKSGTHTYDLSLSELMDFVQSVNRATSKAVGDPKSVSEECDIVVITPEHEAKWMVESMDRLYQLR